MRGDYRHYRAGLPSRLVPGLACSYLSWSGTITVWPVTYRTSDAGGFEPSIPHGTSTFKVDAFNRSAIRPVAIGTYRL